MVDPSQNEYIILASVFVGTAIAAFMNYRRNTKPAAEPTSVVTGIGMEFGNRQQMTEMNEQLTRIADSIELLADQKTAGMQGDIKRLLEMMDDKERRS